MNNGYYANYIVNSDYYKNLSIANNLIKEIKKDISDLKVALSDASGNIIDEMVSELGSLETQLDSYQGQTKEIQNDLKANAALFDGIYDNWKSKIGTVVASGYMVDNIKYTTEDPLTNPGLYARTVKISSVDSIPNLQKQNATSAYAYKYETKLDKVSIGSDNCIHLEYTDYYYGYTKSVMIITVLVQCRDIFKEENRDSKIDYSKKANNETVKFMNGTSTKNDNTYLTQGYF